MEAQNDLPHFGKDAILARDGILAHRMQACQASQTAIDIVMESFLGNILNFKMVLTFISAKQI